MSRVDAGWNPAHQRAIIDAMQPQIAPSIPATRIDGRSLAAAGMCVLALFTEGPGWFFAIAGVYMLRRSSFSSSARWVLALVALGPKLLFTGFRAMSAPAGLSFPIEPSTLATSSALWAWTGLLIGIGLLLLVESRRRPEHPPNEPLPEQPQAGLVLPILGVACVIGGIVLLLGLPDGFQRIDDAGHGRWTLHHAVKGTVADFSATELAGIVVQERHSRGANPYEITVGLKDGRAFCITTHTSSALEELRKFAMTANLPPASLRIVPVRGAAWTSGTSGFTIRDCVGTYELLDPNARPRSVIEFWIENERLSGKETMTDSGPTHVRLLRNLKVNETGDAEFQPASYLEASQQKAEGKIAISFSWSPQTETGKFLPGGFQTGAQKYRRQ
jgi:hypothetical protein